jgi:hypothetical protein|tara:strand:- start:438 stop:572 length:135 start_codon:yes stop_codon:yes gene_type:complete
MNRYRPVKAALRIVVFVLVAAAVALAAVVVVTVSLVIRDFWNMI